MNVKAVEDIQLKFDGTPIQQLGGAPADVVIASLTAIQRIVHLIGMKSEGRAFGQRVKPSAKVRREYAVICKAPKTGSHIQPFNIATQSGAFTPAASVARERLLKTLRAFDSGDEATLEETIPNARERWFLADAAAGLLPSKDSGIDVTIRAGSYGPFNFKADRARKLIECFRSGTPPQPDEETIAGKIKAIDYSRAIATIQPTGGRLVKFAYPPRVEAFLQSNVRKRINILGDPELNSVGDVTSFRRLTRLTELEPSLPAIEFFEILDRTVKAVKPITIPISFDFDDRLFVFQSPEFGVDAYSENFSDIRDNILEEFGVLWRNYAQAADDELASDAIAVKRNLIARFRAV